MMMMKIIYRYEFPSRLPSKKKQSADKITKGGAVVRCFGRERYRECTVLERTESFCVPLRPTLVHGLRVREEFISSA